MQTMSIAIVIPTKGRSEVLVGTLESIRRQTLVPDQLIVSATCASDLPMGQPIPPPVEVVFGPMGLTQQRNTARVRLRSEIGLVFLLDDDMELAEDYLEQMVKVFASHSEIGLLGGSLLANGGITKDDAIAMLKSAPGEQALSLLSVKGLYGCNIGVRADIFRAVDFDENLRMVGWLEDFDWCVRASKHGAVMTCNTARAVHLRANVARTPGYLFGFAQVMNPYYLYRKSVIPTFGEVFGRHWIQVIGSNLSGLARGDSEVDRFGRLRGNLRAFLDIAFGRSDPARIEQLETAKPAEVVQSLPEKLKV